MGKKKGKAKKGSALPVVRTAKQIAAAEERERKRREQAELQAQANATKARAAMLAQVVNLHIAGYSLAQIGASIGATETEVDALLANETQRYVRSQPALRTYVRNYVSGKYSELLETVWDRATDANHKENLESADRALKILDRMARLHGAEAPIQKEIHVEAAPEAVEKLVNALATAQGMGYDASIFDGVSDIVDGEVVHDAVEESHAALEASSRAVEEGSDDPL